MLFKDWDNCTLPACSDPESFVRGGGGDSNCDVFFLFF